MSLAHSNNFSTTLSAAITSTSQTTMTLTSVTGAPSTGSGVSCWYTITDGTNYEIVGCSTALSGSTATIARGQQGTTAQTWSSGATVEINVTKDSLDRKLDAPSAITNYAVFCGPTAANGLPQQIANATPGYVLTYQGSSAIATYTNLNGLATVSASSVGGLMTSNGTSWTSLPTSGSSTRYLANTGTSNAPKWDQINLTNGVTGALPIANGGTNKTSVTTAPTATAFAGWDANSNISAVNFLSSNTSITSAAGTTTLTVASTRVQTVTGTTTQTIQMPVVSTLVLNQTYIIYNTSTGNVTVNSSGGNLICTVYPNQYVEVICTAITGTTAASWLALKSLFLSASTTAASLSTTTATSIVSLSLSPGDWNVWGNFQGVFPGITVDFVLGCINTSVALTTSDLYGLNSMPSGGSVPAASRLCSTVPGRIFQFNSTTTVYLIGYCTFAGGGTITGEGSLFARQIIR